MGAPGWDDLRVVLAVHRAGSVGAAARALRVDKATVLRRVLAAEASLGVRLFDRRSDGYRATEWGKQAVAAAEVMSGAVGVLAGELAGEGEGPRAPVRVTAPVWFARGVIAPALAGFHAAHPQVELRLVSGTSVLNLAQREAEVAVRNVRPRQASTSVKRLGELGSAVYASRAYAQRGLPATPKEALRHAWLGYESTLSFLPAFAWLSDVTPRAVVLRTNETLCLAAAAAAGLGLAVLPCFVGDADSALVRVPGLEPQREVIWLAVPAELRRAAPVRAVMSFLPAVFAQSAGPLAGEPRGRRRPG